MTYINENLSINENQVTHIETWWSGANKDGTLQSLNVIKEWKEKKAILRCQVFIVGRRAPLKFDGPDAVSVSTHIGSGPALIPDGWESVTSMSDLDLAKDDLPF